MKPIEFPEQTTVFAKNQPEYIPLPARVESDGCVTSCYQLSWREVWHLIRYGRKLWLQQLAFGQPLQPQRPSVVKPVFQETSK